MLKKKIIMGTLLFLLIMLCRIAQGTHYYVDPNGLDDASYQSAGKSWENAFATIKFAVDQTSNANDDIIDVNSGEYVTEAIVLKSKLTLRFKEHVTVSAAEGKFPPEITSGLFRASQKKDITFDGNDTIFQMNKEEYTSNGKIMVIMLHGCSNINISGLTLKGSGGDGIYIGVSGYKICKNIIIRDVICDNNKRNGITVIGVDGLLIEDCILKNTNGSSPGAGIDFEPNHCYEDLKNIKVRNTIIENNERSGIDIILGHLYPDPAAPNDVDILIEDVYIADNGVYGILVKRIMDDGPGGTIDFNNVTLTKNNRGAYIFKSYQKVRLSFNNCVWVKPKVFPIKISNYDENDYDWFVEDPGLVDFNDCQVFDDVNRPAIEYCDYEDNPADALHDITGEIYVKNDERSGDLYDWHGADTNNVTIDIKFGVLEFAKANNIVFYVRDSSSGNVAVIDVEGNLLLKGALTAGGTPSATGSDEFRVQDSNSTDIAIIDTTNGDMVIAGSLYEEQETLSPSGGDDFIIKDANDSTVAYIDESGNLCLAGQVYENSDM